MKISLRSANISTGDIFQRGFLACSLYQGSYSFISTRYIINYINYKTSQKNKTQFIYLFLEQQLNTIKINIKIN